MISKKAAAAEQLQESATLARRFRLALTASNSSRPRTLPINKACKLPCGSAAESVRLPIPRRVPPPRAARKFPTANSTMDRRVDLICSNTQKLVDLLDDRNSNQ